MKTKISVGKMDVALSAEEQLYVRSNVFFKHPRYRLVVPQKRRTPFSRIKAGLMVLREVQGETFIMTPPEDAFSRRDCFGSGGTVCGGSALGIRILPILLSCEIMEAFVFHYFEEEDNYGNYDRTKELLEHYSDRLRGKDRDYFHRLRNARNTIAHGGCRSSKGGIPQETNLPGQFNSYHAFLRRIF